MVANPPLCVLVVHEENQQSITIDANADIGEPDVEEAGERNAMLMAWFEANKQVDAIGDFARTLTYQEFPKFCVAQRGARMQTA